MLSAVGVGVWFLVGAAPAHAVELPPLTVPPLPPMVVAPVQVDVGPVHLDPRVAVSPSAPSVAVTTHQTPPSVTAAPDSTPTPPPAPKVRPVTKPAPAHAISAPTKSVHHETIIRPRPAPDVSNARVTGAIVTPPHHAWTQWLGTAARNYGVLLLLLLGALAFRFFMVAALRAVPAPKRL
jgi:hypothetical protein